MPGLTVSTLVRITPSARRAEAIQQLRRGLTEVSELHRPLLVDARVRPAAADGVAAVELQLSSWGDDIDRDFVASLIMQAVEFGELADDVHDAHVPHRAA